MKGQPSVEASGAFANEPREPGRFISRDISQGEKVESELDNFISRSHTQRIVSEGAGERSEAAEEAWQESERRLATQRRARNRQAWIEHYEGQAVRLEATLGLLVARCREEAERLREGVA